MSENSRVSRAFDALATPGKLIAVCAAFAVVGLIITAVANDGNIIPEIVPAQNYGVRIRTGQLVSDELPPALYWKRPFFDDIYHFSNNTVILEATAGSGANTHDQNALTSDFRIHFRVDPKIGLIALHAKDLSVDNGKAKMTEFMTQSVNAVVGSRDAKDTLGDSSTYLRAFERDLNIRLRQNNVPVKVDTIELLAMKVGILRIPVQQRLRVDGIVEDMANPSPPMAGPAAVPVPHARP